MNLAGRGAAAIGLQPIKLSFDTLLNKARENTGLVDFGEDDFRDPLVLLLRGLEQEAQLQPSGPYYRQGGFAAHPRESV